ncbi:MAG: IS200/IS605 family transposase [Deinococcota bacterium]|nr:IS200/IS605 family transposase [Deinococcota bacterium]
MKSYSKGSHTIYHHRYHLVWITKYRYRVLRGELQRRVRTIIAQVAEELGVKIINGVVSSDHIHLLVSIPPQLAVAEFVKRAKGRSSRKVQQEFPEVRKRYWGRHFWARGYFSATSGNVTDEMIDEYINNHYDAHKRNDEENISLE